MNAQNEIEDLKRQLAAKNQVIRELAGVEIDIGSTTIKVQYTCEITFDKTTVPKDKIIDFVTQQALTIKPNTKEYIRKIMKGEVIFSDW